MSAEPPPGPGSHGAHGSHGASDDGADAELGAGASDASIATGSRGVSELLARITGEGPKLAPAEVEVGSVGGSGRAPSGVGLKRNRNGLGVVPFFLLASSQKGNQNNDLEVVSKTSFVG